MGIECGGHTVLFGQDTQGCIVYTVDSVVVYQAAIERNSKICSNSPDFFQQMLLEGGIKGTVLAMCCTKDGCNRSIPRGFMPGRGVWLEEEGEEVVKNEVMEVEEVVKNEVVEKEVFEKKQNEVEQSIVPDTSNPQSLVKAGASSVCLCSLLLYCFPLLSTL